ncbi:Dam family site-specific DNA-(adenine-N6)-methyltransferase [Alcanivorax sp. NBRC 102028]|uniref:DNA adenine methylase n=1 Tax=Alcanivorax sp. NBRC 102028 TaxID=1113897 RepID=UPI000789EEBD|nr:Dam family site-specific DNA-(adenine-N6)-methyltransferase [Alcanivorax sp. NBRC 102028]
MSSFLRWAGSKRQLIPTLHTYWNNDFQTYHEPFLGSGSLLFSAQPSKATANDLNEDLIQMYRAVRDSPDEVYLSVTSLEVSKEKYYEIRSQDPRHLNPVDIASRFIYLNRFCFNGIYRTNRSGKFNVPYSGNKTGSIPDLEIFHKASKQLRKTQLTSLDFEEVIMENIKEGDFFYLDPPYLSEGKRIFNEYGPEKFDDSDLSRLLNCIESINDAGAFFVFSFYKCPTLIKKLCNFKITTVETRRTISSSTSSRKKMHEIIITNIPANTKKITGT